VPAAVNREVSAMHTTASCCMYQCRCDLAGKVGRTVGRSVTVGHGVHQGCHLEKHSQGWAL